MKPLAEATTLRVGGAPQQWIDVHTRDELMLALKDRESARTVILGGGSNVVCADDMSEWTVINVRTQGMELFDADDAVLAVCEAGEEWSAFVDSVVAQGLAGVSALAGIPGTVGAAPLQNIGAYGAEVSEVIDHVVVLDREQRSLRTLSTSDCGFSYRSSMFKADPSRFAIVAVAFLLSPTGTEVVRYPALADHLGIKVGESVAVSDIRDAVIELRTQRGMVLDAHDHDTWSVGSFFVNPIVTAEQAENLPSECPRYPAASGVKLSAAWLIEHAGIARGYSLTEPARASTSTKHVLAITNRGDASTADVLDLARDIRDRVNTAWNITLEPEPRLVGCSL